MTSEDSSRPTANAIDINKPLTVSHSSPSSIASLQDKVALITGASSGLGRAIALAYAAAGAYVVCADLSPNPPKTPLLAVTLPDVDFKTPTHEMLNEQFPPAGPGKTRAVFVETDVTIAALVEAAVAAAVRHFARLDVMVNSAGVLLEAKGKGNLRVHECAEETWDGDMAVNAKGTWLGCKYATKQMLEQAPHSSGDRGWIINMGSVMSFVGLPSSSPYCASKGAVLQLTKAIALEYAQDRIHVNCINPGFTETSMIEALKTRGGGVDYSAEAMTARFTSLHPWGRLGKPDDIARAAVFLAGEGASFITGQTLVVDGGYLAR